MNFKLEIGKRTDVGKVRAINEDNFDSLCGDYGHLLIVCDGMGGHKGGEVASRLSVEAIKKHFLVLNGDYNPPAELTASVQAANKTLLETGSKNPDLNDMGSTIVIALVKDGKLFTANLGDSRIYIVRNGEIIQLTRDHSLVQQMIDSNLISPEAAKYHPKKNIITKSLGIDIETKPDISDPIELLREDILILCSDGLTTYVDDKEILAITANHTPQNAADRLVDLANDRGGSDNTTVLVVKMN